MRGGEIYPVKHLIEFLSVQSSNRQRVTLLARVLSTENGSVGQTVTDGILRHSRGRKVNTPF